jgi:hypothetical protein
VLKLVPLRTNLMVADALTKSLTPPAHAKHRDHDVCALPPGLLEYLIQSCARGGRRIVEEACVD